MTQPARVERVWLALARATLLTLSVGEEAQEAQETASPVRAFRRGQFRILACLVTGETSRWGRFHPPTLGGAST